MVERYTLHNHIDEVDNLTDLWYVKDNLTGKSSEFFNKNHEAWAEKIRLMRVEFSELTLDKAREDVLKLRWALCSIWTALEYGSEALDAAQTIVDEALAMTQYYSTGFKDLTCDCSGLDGWNRHKGHINSSDSVRCADIPEPKGDTK